MEKLPKITRPEYIGDLLKNADEIDHNNEMLAQLAAQGSTNIILYVLGSSASILIITYIFFNYVKTSKPDNQNMNNARSAAVPAVFVVPSVK